MKTTSFLFCVCIFLFTACNQHNKKTANNKVTIIGVKEAMENPVILLIK